MTVIEVKTSMAAFTGAALAGIGAEVAISPDPAAIIGAIITIGIALTGGLIAGGVAFGILKNQSQAAHDRIDRLEQQHDNRFAALEHKLDARFDELTHTLSDVRSAVSGILGELKGRS